MEISKLKFLRSLLIPIIKQFGSDITIRHHWVRDAIVNLHSFRHKGYWFYGKKRELKTMHLFEKLIKSGDKVVEVGGHIGYISIFFSKLVGVSGSVIVFEPGTNNLAYIKKNIRSDKFENVRLLELAVGGDSKGTVTFYEDDLTGQNNSLVKDFEGLKNNQKNSYVDLKVEAKKVTVTTLDLELSGAMVDFVKIDIEGGEWPAIFGSKNIINKNLPAFMVEIQANRLEIFNFFGQNNYVGFNEDRTIIDSYTKLNGNIFWLHKRKHKALIDNLGLN